MSGLKTASASVCILLGGIAVLGFVTHDFRLFTTESVLRAEVQAQPRRLPDARLQTATDRIVDLEEFKGSWLFVNFIYTRCLTLCSVQGGEFSELQRRLAGPVKRGELRLLSVSFDPVHDSPPELTKYKMRFGDPDSGWIAARPADTHSLVSLKKALGVRVIPDGLGGFEHNAAINVVNPSGELVAILDWDDVKGACGYIAQRLVQSDKSRRHDKECL